MGAAAAGKNEEGESRRAEGEGGTETNKKIGREGVRRNEVEELMEEQEGW